MQTEEELCHVVFAQLRRIRESQRRVAHWHASQTEVMCSIIAELNRICEKVSPHIYVQPPSAAQPEFQATVTGGEPQRTHAAAVSKLFMGEPMDAAERSQALLLLTPSSVHRLSQNSIIPQLAQLAEWLKEPQCCHHSFLLLHEIFCQFPWLADVPESTHVRAALVKILADRTVLSVLQKRNVARSTVEELHQFVGLPHRQSLVPY